MWKEIIEFLKEPLIIPAYSAFLAVLLTFSAQRILEKRKYNKARKGALNLLFRELKFYIETFVSIESNLCITDKVVLPSVDSYAIKTFLESKFIDTTKDSDVILKLHSLILSISALNRAILRIDIASAGMGRSTEELEKRMKTLLVKMSFDVDACLNELKRTYPKLDVE